MGNTNSSSGTSTKPGENENMETLFIGIALVIAAVVIYLIINNSNCKKRYGRRYSIETYINDSKTILRDMTNTSLSLAKYAQDYVTERTNRESSFRAYVDGGNQQLEFVKSEQQKAKNAYNNANISVNLNNAVSDASRNAANAETAYTNIVAYNNGAGNVFGSALKNIQIQKSTADRAFNEVKNTISDIERIYTGITSAESIIVNSYNNANTSLSSFRAFINTLKASIENSGEYVNLRSKVDEATILRNNLQGIATELGDDDQYVNEVNTLIGSLNTAIDICNGYLSNSITIFNLATTGASVQLIASISQLVDTYNLMAAYIGRTESSVIPLSNPLPTLPPNEGTIKSYVDEIKTVAGTVIANYNRVIDYYNKIITNLNLIQTFTSEVHDEVGNVSNTFNTSLDEAGNIMKNYLPGSTIPPRTPYPNYVTNAPFPTFPTLTPMSV
jgi:hypothetical protein